MAALAIAKAAVNIASTIGVRQIITGIVDSNVVRESLHRKVTVFVAKELISAMAVAAIKDYVDRGADTIAKDYKDKMAAAQPETA